MTLNHYATPDKTNMFCKLKNLRNEADVEQFFIIKLLKALGFDDDFIETKKTIPEESLGKGKKKHRYHPDYLVYLDRRHEKPVLVIDAKNPHQNAEEGLSDAQLYVSIIRRRLKAPKPEQYCVGTNGLRLVVKHYDSDDTLHDLTFDDFQVDHPKYIALEDSISLEKLKRPQAMTQQELFEFKKPPKDEIIGIFRACHNLIWKAEKSGPAAAFYEFAKLMFIKLSLDKKLRSDDASRKRIENGEPLLGDDIVFSSHWVKHEERTDSNPVNTTLFKNLRDELDTKIRAGEKKRIFAPNEQIDLKPSTIKRVVELLEHYDLYGVDEDLNGRLFETFLNATMRGKALGQFFTPRPVVEFMTSLAGLRVAKDQIDRVLDACCGTGGFLIAAMAEMSDRVNKNESLTSEEKKAMLKELRDNCLFGIDVGKDPPIARIARINMYLHGDGGSRIYVLDSLDKYMTIEKGLDKELERDISELKTELIKRQLKFHVVLTNPPFAMRYSVKDRDQKSILKQYDLAYDPIGKDKTKKLRTSLRSSVMFIERYWELLQPHGKLLTIMDESVLNTKSNEVFRDYIKEKFIIRAVVSLPQNTFVNAESGVKTSVLYLVKKTTDDEQQPKVFMAISRNVGHGDTGKETPEKSDLDSILEDFKKFESGEFRN
jgi:type I restriction enzyme M protein